MTSYIIARTLGIIEDTKASTSDRQSLHPVSVVEGPGAKPPTIIVQSASVAGTMPTSPDLAGTDTTGDNQTLEIDRSDTNNNHPQSTSLSSLYEGNPALAGVGVFSPAASTPSSPTIEKERSGSLSKINTTVTPLSRLDDENGNDEKAITTGGQGEEEGATLGVRREGSWGSMSAGLDSSYAFIDRELVPEDSGVLRRRQNRQTVKPTGS